MSNAILLLCVAISISYSYHVIGTLLNFIKMPHGRRHPLYLGCQRVRKNCFQTRQKVTKKFLYLAISFICHIIHECSSQWDLYDSEEVGQSVGRSQSLPPSKISWSVGRKACRQVKSVGRTYGRLVITLVGHKVGRSYGRSVIRSVGHKVGRSYGRSVIWSVSHKIGWSYGGSVIRSVGHMVGRS